MIDIRFFPSFLFLLRVFWSMSETTLSKQGPFETSGTYRIRVKGVVDARWSDWLGGMTITTRESEGSHVTDMVGKVADQAVLAGILNALYEMHLPLLRVEFLRDGE
jgi:hypothetical protein